MRTFLLFFSFFVFAFIQQPSLKAQSTKPLNWGEIQTISSVVLQEKRELNIYLPQGYDAQNPYPVIYLLDGSRHEDFVHICGIVQFFNLMLNMPPTIVVGIENVDRKRDFTFPTTDLGLKEKTPTSGGSEKFMTFLEKELIPFIEKTYKVTEQRYLIGQSLGGLMASEILLKKADLFTHYFIVSPSLWWDNESMLKQAPTLYAQQSDKPRFVYIAVGKEEPKIMQKEAKALKKIVKNSGKKNTRLYFSHMEDENHATILHQAIYWGLTNIFPYPED